MQQGFHFSLSKQKAQAIAYQLEPDQHSTRQQSDRELSCCTGVIYALGKILLLGRGTMASMNGLYSVLVPSRVAGTLPCFLCRS